MWLVVGLGNPGRDYAQNRHNVGFMVVEELAERVRAEPFRAKFSAQMSRARIGDREAILLKPTTYMNLSGDSVQPCAAFFKVAPKDIFVVHDEIDLPFGTLRLKFGGGHAGHNGVRSLVGRLGTGDFARLRVGVGRPGGDFRGENADWVLTNFSGEERQKVPELVARAVETVLDIAARGFEAAMKTTNTRPRRTPSSEPDETNAEAKAEAKATAKAEAKVESKPERD